MLVDARAQSWAALALSGVGPRPLAELLRAFGGPEAVLAATPAQRRAAVAATAAAALESVPDPDRLAATLAWLGEDGHGFLAWDDDDYPPSLLEIGDPPPILFCLGRRELLGRPALAVVGSRNATPQGCDDAEAFAFALSSAGLTIVSGLASGIDAAAHRGGLAGAGEKHRGRGHRTRPRLPGVQSRPRPRAREGRPHPVRVRRRERRPGSTTFRGGTA